MSLCPALSDKVGSIQGWTPSWRSFPSSRTVGFPPLCPCPLGGLALPPHTHSAQTALEEKENHFQFSFLPSQGVSELPAEPWLSQASDNSCEFTPGDSLLKVLPCHNPPTQRHRWEKTQEPLEAQLLLQTGNSGQGQL